ncbi:hypothetical protein, partial [Evtepia gabavorous]|uniref:hypothetical protein n=1 Tax=Evtepia gabavorous TaxID=2211183 RepID=UPI003A8E8599
LWIHDLALENLARYWITIIVHSVVLAVAMYQAGLRMNAKTKRQSMAGPVGDQVIAIVIPPIVSVTAKFSYLVDPYAAPLATYCGAAAIRNMRLGRRKTYSKCWG